MNEWGLMVELAVLRIIYLLGSGILWHAELLVLDCVGLQTSQVPDVFADVFLSIGDLLQHFFTVIFGKLDKGETWDDDFELNTILQVFLAEPFCSSTPW